MYDRRMEVSEVARSLDQRIKRFVLVRDPPIEPPSFIPADLDLQTHVPNEVLRSTHTSIRSLKISD